MDTLPDIVKSAMEDINADSMIMWVFYSIPRLERWTSEKRRAAILGDAAHAIPPTTGQGASQAFEDVMSLVLLLSTLKENPGIKWEEALDFWQKMRQDGIDDLLVLTKQLNNKRLPLEKRKLLGKGEVWSKVCLWLVWNASKRLLGLGITAPIHDRAHSLNDQLLHPRYLALGDTLIIVLHPEQDDAFHHSTELDKTPWSA
ncbi:hypothetical protein F4823DRAFT_566024 [Ustulina deusta]|nr:hypothetical protein F4823DRAFT_566024 [Ustulina deusta]